MKNTCNYTPRQHGGPGRSFAGRQRSSSIFGQVTCIVVGVVAGVGVAYCIGKRKEIGSRLSNFMTSSFKKSASNNFSNKGRRSEGSSCHTDSYTTSFVYVDHVNITTNNITNITINPDESVPEENISFSGSNHAATSHVPPSECVVDSSCLFGCQGFETGTSPSPVDSDTVQVPWGMQRDFESTIVLSTSTFCLSLSADVIERLFSAMCGRCFHKTTSLRLFTYVLTGKGEKPEGPISIEWIATPRSFALFIGIVCAPYWDKWKTAKGLFTGRINVNPSGDFGRFCRNDLVKGNKVSTGFENNEKFQREKDLDVKFLLILLSGFS